MSGSNTSKIERVHAPGNLAVWVDLCLDKRSGTFWSRVGTKEIREPTKEAALKATREALSQIAGVQWRQLIVVTVPRQRPEHDSSRNGIPSRSECCSISYERVERAPNPMREDKQIERLHPIDFEEVVQDARESAASRNYGAEKRRRMDEVEEEKRLERSTLQGSHSVYDWEKDLVYEIPYSDEAWAGIERIAATIKETQRRLDEFAGKWTTDSLAKLGAGVDVSGLFLPMVKPPLRLRGGGGKKKP